MLQSVPVFFNGLQFLPAISCDIGATRAVPQPPSPSAFVDRPAAAPSNSPVGAGGCTEALLLARLHRSDPLPSGGADCGDAAPQRAASEARTDALQFRLCLPHDERRWRANASRVVEFAFRLAAFHIADLAIQHR